MPRIRTIKPEFWADEKLSLLDPTTRLVFLGLISMADDAGRLVDSLKQIDAFIFPFTDDSSREALANLSRMARVRRGETASGQRVIQIVNWKHQKVDHPNLSAALPPIVKEVSPSFANGSRDSRDALATLSVPVPTISTSTKATTSASGEAAPKARNTVPEKPNSWVVEGTEWWRANIGAMTHGHFGKALKDEVGARGWPVVFAAIKCYAKNREKFKAPKVEWFADEMVKWVEWSNMKATDEFGDLTPLGRALREAR
jgi:hypothetical protein